jgi:hypothetical protein
VHAGEHGPHDHDHPAMPPTPRARH